MASTSIFIQGHGLVPSSFFNKWLKVRWVSKNVDTTDHDKSTIFSMSSLPHKIKGFDRIHLKHASREAISGLGNLLFTLLVI